MNHCKPNILIESKNFNITQCTKCKRIGLYYRNLLAGFHSHDFKRWANTLLRIDFEKNAHVFPSGKSHIIINTCHQDIQFIFTEKEFQRIRGGITQALLLLQAQALVQSN